MNMTNKEKKLHEYITRLLKTQGYKTYAKLFSNFDLNLTNNPEVIAFMEPGKGRIVVNETLDENTINDESSVKEKDRGLARVISFMNTEHFCIDVFTFEPVNPYANKYNEQKLIDIVFNPPIIIENQVPSQFPFSLINYSSLTHKKNNIELLKPFSLYNIFPDDHHTLMKISLDYYNDVYSSHLFNIYELK